MEPLKDNERITPLVFSVVSILISLLFASNVFFIKRLVDKLDNTEQIVWELRQQVAVLKATLEDMTVTYSDCFKRSRPKR